MGAFETASQDAILAAGRNAEWTAQPTYTGRPANIGAGGDMKDTINALVKIDLRENIAFRTVRVTSDTFDAASTYTVTINGTVHTSATPATLDAMVEAIEAAINGGAQAANVTALSVDAAGVDDPGNNTTVLITGDNEDDYTLNVGVSGGAGTIDADADPSSATARLYGLDGPQTTAATARPNKWTDIRWPKTDTIDLPVDNRGYTERLDVASVQRMYVELADVVGAFDGIPTGSATITYVPIVTWGPSIFIST